MEQELCLQVIHFIFQIRITMNETIWLVFNVTYNTVAQTNASAVNVTVNCSGVGDTLTGLVNATYIGTPTITDGYQAKYTASCKATINSSGPIYLAGINIAVKNTSDAAGATITSTSAIVTLYNMTTHPFIDPTGCQG